MIFGIYLSGCLCDLNVVYQWNKLSLILKDNYYQEHASYIPENNLVYRMKIWNNTLFMAIPRFKQGVPATLCSRYDDTIRPYPSLGLQIVGNCYGMQNVKDIEIDHLGNLWMLDIGKVYDLEISNYSCDPKLFVLNLNTGKIIRSAVLPNSMYTNQSILSGISLDLKTLTAVITDIGPDPGFIVYNLQIGIFYKFSCKQLATTNGYNEALLTISPFDNMLYFTTLELSSLLAIPLSVFGAPLINDVSHYVNNQGLKTDTATAMIMDTAGNLYLGMTRKVIAWNTLKHNFDVKELYIQEVRLDWISSFAFDSSGYLWIISSEFKNFQEPNSKKSDVLIFKRYCGTTSFALQEVAESFVNNMGSSINAIYTVDSFIRILTLLILNIFSYNIV